MSLVILVLSQLKLMFFAKNLTKIGKILDELDEIKS